MQIQMNIFLNTHHSVEKQNSSYSVFCQNNKYSVILLLGDIEFFANQRNPTKRIKYFIYYFMVR